MNNKGDNGESIDFITIIESEEALRSQTAADKIN